jgi:peptidoglycan hydrolase-like protein with peptidoglycan-binding domain
MAQVEPKVRLPVLNPGDSGDAVARVQHILNDLDRWSGVETLLNENGDYGHTTRDRVYKFQEDNRISGPTGGVGERTWKALLEEWLIESVGG